ncbi:MAG: hypothetical protein QNJ09_09300 [Paracoccaceae bacterium]|nr:hypothetical protein [Paracoccaceae bacterium]
MVRKVSSDLAKAQGQREALRQATKPIKDAGFFDLTLARKHGGENAQPSDVTKAVAKIARIDGSVGFLVSQALLGHIMTAGFPEGTLSELHRDEPARIAGVFAPKGRAARTEKGWTVSGTWPLATGAIMSDWVYLQCLATDGRRVIADASGRPISVLTVIPTEHLHINQNWRAPGLQLTASDEVTATRVDVPGAFAGTLQPLGKDEAQGIPVVPFDASGFSGLTIAAVGVGLAHALTDELTALGVAGRRATFSRSPMPEAPLPQADLGRAVMLAEAADALLQKSAEGVFGTTKVGRAKTQASCAAVVDLCNQSAELIFACAGKVGLDRHSAIWKHYADLRTLSLHAWCSKERIAPLGAVLMGGTVDPMILPDKQT